MGLTVETNVRVPSESRLGARDLHRRSGEVADKVELELHVARRRRRDAVFGQLLVVFEDLAVEQQPLLRVRVFGHLLLDEDLDVLHQVVLLELHLVDVVPAAEGGVHGVVAVSAQRHAQRARPDGLAVVEGVRVPPTDGYDAGTPLPWGPMPLPLITSIVSSGGDMPVQPLQQNAAHPTATG
eukprot:CAMPEP_0180132844 /NCGR_PEP_ID=MMETSP0986-20121125/9213_1 /TAXON_ID=697907 /ORGANISM="non described non described, Strain CCMP2293" /LENGTH=181 /DNA_ID=CAMNT_0022072901 /DNA_START=253 /DNA_END=794 /DNA_ORIENTATION=-